MVRDYKKEILTSIIVIFLCVFCYKMFLRMYVSGQPTAVEEQLEMMTIEGDDWQTPSATELTCRIPESYDTHLVLYLNSSYLPFDVYLDDTCLLEYREDPNVNPISVVFLPLPDNAAGKTLSLRNFASEASRDIFRHNTTQLGSCILVMRQFYTDNAYVILHLVLIFLLLSFFLLLYGFVSGLISTTLKKSITHLVLFFLVTEIWIYTDSDLPAICSIPKRCILFLNYFSVANMPISFLLFLMKFYDRKDRRITIFMVLSEACVLGSLAAWLLAGYPIVSNFLIIELLVAAYIVIIARIAVSEYLARHNRSSFFLLAGLVYLVVAGLFCCIAYLRNPGSGYLKIFTFATYAFYCFLAFPLVTSVADLVNQKVKTDYYRQIAFTDSLTGLKNRASFMEKLKHWDEDIKACPEDMCVLMLDINDLKKVNDTFGHAKGDELIENAALCILTAFAPAGECYRIGGDEFAVILEHETEEHLQQALAEMNRSEAERSKGLGLTIGIAYGVSWNTRQRYSLEALFRIADDAMYTYKKQMKEAGHKTVS